MKISLFLIVCASVLFACKKDDTTVKVTYKVTGSQVDQFKITNGSNEQWVKVPFTGTRDTTVYIPYGTNVKLDAKADGAAPLAGTIYINDKQVAMLTDTDNDGDNKTQVKVDYAIPVQ